MTEGKADVVNFELGCSGLFQIKAKQTETNLKNSSSNDGEKY